MVEKRVTGEGDSRHRMGLGACQWSRRSLGYARLEVPGKAFRKGLICLQSLQILSPGQ